MTNVTRETFRSLFEDRLHLLQNAACERCDAQIRNPLLPWIVGERFLDAAERVIFIGKPHRGLPGELLPSGVIDPTEMVAESLWGSSWPYWSYTREVAERLYGPHASDYIAFTNVIKCTNVGADDGSSSSADATTYRMAQCCVSDLGVIWREIEQLRPFTLVFYTYGLFRDVIKPIPVALNGSLREVTPEDHFVMCKNKHLGWWERTCRTSWTDNLRILVMGHPERMGRPEFVQLLTQWLRPNPAMQPTGSAVG